MPRACPFICVLEGQHPFCLGEFDLQMQLSSLYGVIPGTGAVLLAFPQSLTSPSGKLSHSSCPVLVAAGCTHHLWWQGGRRSPSVPLLMWGCLRLVLCAWTENTAQNQWGKTCSVTFAYSWSGYKKHFYHIDLKGWIWFVAFFFCVYQERFVLFSDKLHFKKPVCFGYVENKPLCMVILLWICFFLSVHSD